MLTCDGGGGHEHDGQPDGRGEDPVADVDYLGVVRRPEVQCFDRMAHSDVAVDAHGGEREDRDEHVVVVDGHHHLAQNVPKGPGPHQVVDALERQRAGDQGVGEGEVEDVDVCGSLHFCVSARKAWTYHQNCKRPTNTTTITLDQDPQNDCESAVSFALIIFLPLLFFSLSLLLFVVLLSLS